MKETAIDLSWCYVAGSNHYWRNSIAAQMGKAIYVRRIFLMKFSLYPDSNQQPKSNALTQNIVYVAVTGLYKHGPLFCFLCLLCFPPPVLVSVSCLYVGGILGWTPGRAVHLKAVVCLLAYALMFITRTSGHFLSFVLLVVQWIFMLLCILTNSLCAFPSCFRIQVMLPAAMNSKLDSMPLLNACLHHCSPACPSFTLNSRFLDLPVLAVNKRRTFTLSKVCPPFVVQI